MTDKVYETKAVVGKPFVIAFSDAASVGGYKWENISAPNDDLEVSDAGDLADVAGLVAGFNVLAKKAGTYTLEFVQKRFWEDDACNKQTYNVDVRPD